MAVKQIQNLPQLAGVYWCRPWFLHLSDSGRKGAKKASVLACGTPTPTDRRVDRVLFFLSHVRSARSEPWDGRWQHVTTGDLGNAG